MEPSAWRSLAVAGGIVLAFALMIMMLTRLAVRRTDRYLRRLLRRENLEPKALDKTVRNRMWA